MAARKARTREAPTRTTPNRKARTRDQIFAVEVEPGVFAYSPGHKLPAATRRVVDQMVAEGAERTRQAAQEIREILAARRNGDSAHATS